MNTRLALVTGATSGIGKAFAESVPLTVTPCAPGVEDASLLQQVFAADLAAFGAQSPQLASRYRRA